MKGLVTFWLIFAIYIAAVELKKADKAEKPQWAKKDIRDYNDADLERLYDQWEEEEEPLENDELPEHLRKPASIDLTKLDMSDPEGLLKVTKKGKTIMAFVSVTGNPTRQETEEITTLWQTSLLNNHISVDRFLIDDNRAIFMFKDGALAWEAKDFLVQQDRLQQVIIENKPYYGKYSDKKDESMGPNNKEEL